MQNIEKIKNSIEENIQELEAYRDESNCKDVDYYDCNVSINAYYDMLKTLNELGQEKPLGRITREIRRQKMISLVENLSADHCLSSPAYIFDVPSEVVDYIIDKDIDLSTYSYIDTIQRGNKKLVIFGTFGLVEKFIIFMLVEKHRSFNIYPCTMKNKNKEPSFMNVKPNKDVAENLTGNEFTKSIEIIVRTNYF